MKLKIYYNAIKYRVWYFFNKKKYKNLGAGSFIKSPLSIVCPWNIEIGEKVFIGYKSWLAANSITGSKNCVLKFGDNCTIGNFNHIYATSKIVFEKSVLTADKVYISDNIHCYDDINVPIQDQKIIQKREVHIGEGTWIGENVCIIGVNIGKNCVIGANSVVIKDVDDFSVVAGNPATLIKKYCFQAKKWKRVNPDGSFK